jgi:hypothetical protein
MGWVLFRDRVICIGMPISKLQRFMLPITMLNS